MNSFFHERLQHDPATQPISFVGGQFFGRVATFPTNPDPIALDVVEKLEGFTLVETVKHGATRFALRRADGTVLEPMPQVRQVRVMIRGKNEYFNVAALLASSILRDDVTDNEFGILIGEDGLFIESAADRAALCADLERKCLDLPRVELGLVPRPSSSHIDVTGKGYYVERGGVVYKKNGDPIHVTQTGKIMLAGKNKKQEIVGLGWILFGAYPAFYGYRHGLHTQMDHINGNSRDNEAWNFRPMTRHQNAAVRHCTGSRSERPSHTSSHETFKRAIGDQLTPENIAGWKAAGSLKRYMNTSYWMHSDGAVLRQLRGGSFIFPKLIVNRWGYTYIGGVGLVHIMMMKAFGTHGDNLKVMHLDDDKQNNRLANLRMGTSQGNAAGKKPVTIHIRNEDGTLATNTYESEREAARRTGIVRPTIHENRKRQRSGSSPVFTTTRAGITFTTGPSPSETGA